MPNVTKDEKKYAECVDLLDQLERWARQVYSVKIQMNESTHSDSVPALASPTPPPITPTTPSAIQLHFRPEQPGSGPHVPPTSCVEDPLHGVTV